MTWPVVPIGRVIRSAQYGLSIASDQKGTVPIVGMKDIQDGVVHVDHDVRVLLPEGECKPYLLREGDILINRTNSPDLVGKAGIFAGTEMAVFASYLVRLELDREYIDPNFLIQVLASSDGQRRIRQLATRAVSQANLNPTTFRTHFYISLPPLEVQFQIRDVLMTWDSAIGKSARLIAAKFSQLSQLRERLVGRGASKHARLREATKESLARNGSTLGRDQIMGVTNDRGMRPMREETIATSIDRYKIVRPRAFAYNPMRLNVGSIVMSPFDRDVLVSPDCVVFECDESKLLPGYLNHLRFTRHWSSFFDVAGSGSVRVRIYYDDLAAFTFPLPPVEQQHRLVVILDTAVAEIDALTKYVGALRRQKRGLMQKLLTGQWRPSAHELTAEEHSLC